MAQAGSLTLTAHRPEARETGVGGRRSPACSLQECASTPIGEIESEKQHFALTSETGLSSEDRPLPGHHTAKDLKKLIFRNFQSPGDIVMLTAAVRDLHLSYPRQFAIDVRTSCPALWENNPYLTALAEEDGDVEVVDCHYPLVHHSNRIPYHFIHGFIDYLNEKLGLQIRPTAFK
jgi:hypothetical protein